MPVTTSHDSPGSCKELMGLVPPGLRPQFSSRWKAEDRHRRDMQSAEISWLDVTRERSEFLAKERGI